MKTCLVVDDSGTVRSVLKQILQGIGYVVHEAENGRDALDLVEEVGPDLVLLDWMMPVMDGLDFVRHFRGQASGRNCRIIFCTSVTEPMRIEEALEAGADEYIMKPFDVHIIKEKLALVGLQH